MKTELVTWKRDTRRFWLMAREDGFMVRITWNALTPWSMDVMTYDGRESTAWNDYTTVIVPGNCETPLYVLADEADFAARSWIALYGPLFA